MKNKRAINVSMFSKLLLTFLVVGMLPLFLTGSALYKRLAHSAEKIISVNAAQNIRNFGLNIENMLGDYDEVSQYPYEYESQKYSFLYEILKDDMISDEEKEAQITEMLSNILNANPYMVNVRFVTGEKVYFVSSDATKILNRRAVLDNQWDYLPEEIRGYHVFTVDSDNRYYYNSDQLVFTVARNYMDAFTVSGAVNNVLGTVYLDISLEQFGIMEQGIDLGENSYIHVYDTADGRCVYSRNESEVGNSDEMMLALFPFFTGKSGTYRDHDTIYSYYYIENTQWIAISAIAQGDVVSAYEENRRYFAVFLTIISAVMAIMFYIFSEQITEPTRILKNAMGQLESGNLETRVAIRTHDEMEILGNGFNQMAKNLQDYIDRVYLAEIRQRDAELNVLKTTIRPHYLYNTLEVIRMTALTNNDVSVAEMLGCLSKQLRYLMGSHTSLVTVREEIESIRDYFYIVQIRYENRFELEIDISSECMDLYVLKLLLQPIVENAVKHGLRPKQGNGKISIGGFVDGECLQLTVMDDGIGMSEEQVQALLSRLETPYEAQKESAESVGMKNVYDRIRMKYGEKYGYSIISMKEMGTIVKYCLPVIRERGEKSESGSCG